MSRRSRRASHRPARGALIGRSADCDLRLDRPEVSRKHARLLHQGTAWSLQGRGSTQGVWLQRGSEAPRRVSKVDVQPGDLVYVGGFALTLR